MRKVILSMMVSLDGYIEAPGRDIYWHVWDDEMNGFMGDFFNRVDTLLFGRNTYELMLSYWPTTTSEDPVITERMNNLPKIVFSRTLEKVEWNSRLMKDNALEEIIGLKQQPGRDMVIFGGANLASWFMRHQLIDEYQLIVNPVVLGWGTPLFLNIQEKFNLKLMSSQAFQCGNIVLHYEPANNQQETRIQTELREAMDDLLHIISSLDAEQLNRVPFEGSWTAAQVGEHLLKSYGVVEILKGNTRPTRRPIDEKVKAIEDIFLDFNLKMESPEFIVPSKEKIDKNYLLQGLKEKIGGIIDFSRQKDLDATCIDFEVPGFGPFTKLEWMHFVKCHTFRHVRQLKNILHKLNGASTDYAGLYISGERH